MDGGNGRKVTKKAFLPVESKGSLASHTNSRHEVSALGACTISVLSSVDRQNKLVKPTSHDNKPGQISRDEARPSIDVIPGKFDRSPHRDGLNGR
jgi:hypothetical protein